MKSFAMPVVGVRAAAVMTVFLLLGLVPSRGFSQTGPGAVSSGPDGAARITLGDGRTITVSRERGQAGVSGGQVAPDGTAGWLAEFRVDGVSYPVAEMLVIWRAGKIIRRFETGQAFYSWAFYDRGKQVAYHAGPLHGEGVSHCELHDIGSGRTLAVWEGDLESHGDRPAWTKGLTR